MTSTAMGSLREIQKIDRRIKELKKALATFDERLAEVEEPALALESELNQVTERLTQMKADARRLERSSEDKRARAEKMDQRLNRVSNLREEAAVQVERDLIRRAIESDDQEAMQVLDHIGRTEDTLEELQAAAAEARAGVEPQQAKLNEDRELYAERVSAYEARREEALANVGVGERRVYDSFHASGRAIVVAPLLDDGACGHCFGVIPLQLQNEIRSSGGLIRCENCGVILTSEPEPVFEDDLTAPLPDVDASIEAAEEAAEAAEAEADAEAEAVEEDDDA